jgi:hypothetical protein
VANAGHHLSPRQLSSGRDVFEELGEGFTLLAFGVVDGAVAPLEGAARALRVPLKVVRDTYDGDREAYACRMVLVRPDQYVVWSGDEPPRDAAQLLKKVAGIT